MGLILAVVVHRADLQDREGAKALRPFIELYGWLQTIFVDGGYRGKFVEWIAGLSTHRNIRVEVVKKKNPNQFEVLPMRWVVERTFAWLGDYRRLSKDYEIITEHSESMIYIAATRLMLKRLTRK